MASEGSGERLRVLLQRAQLTPEQLASALNRLAAQSGLGARIDRKTPYKWLRGHAPRNPWPALVAAALSQQIGTAVQTDDIGWRGGVTCLEFVPASAGLDVPWTGAGTISAVREVAEVNVVDRRVFLQLSGVALTQPSFDWLLAQPASDVDRQPGRRVTDSLVDSVEAITAHLRGMDDQLGGGRLLDVVNSQVRYVLGLLSEGSYSSTVGTRLHAAAAELLRLSGWVNYDAGRHAQAQRAWLAALHAAHSAGDRAIGANILGFMSIQAKNLGQRVEAVRLAEAARHGYPGASPRVSAILNFHVAQAYAAAGDVKPCRTALDTAYEVFRDQTPDSSEPAWSYWFDEAAANEQIGHSYLSLGDWRLAQNHLSTAIRLLPASCTRDVAMYRVYLALVYAKQGEPERACEIANKAIDTLADEVDSTRCTDRIRRVQDALLPYQKVPAVRELRARVSRLPAAAQA